jgi:hypothetical protein
MLREAVMRTAWPELTAGIQRHMQELRGRGVLFDAPDWWADQYLEQPATRHEEMDGPNQQLTSALRCNQAAVEAHFRDELYEGKLVCCGREGSSLAEYRLAPKWAITGIESWWKGGGILRLESGERLYTARVKPRRAVGISESKVAEWIDSRINNETLKGEDAMWDEFKADLHADFSKTRFLAIRKTRMNNLGVASPRPGRPTRR